MTFLITSALMMANPVMGTFRPTVSVSDALSGLQMCRTVVTPSGFDDQPFKKAHWQALKLRATSDENPADVKALKAWSPPNSFMMVLLSPKGGKWRCNVAAPLGDRQAGADLVAKLPVRLTLSEKPGEFDGEDSGQQIHVSMGDNPELPTINITVSRPMEPK
jgi:hypothetical protein